jgi:hypothetical protein
MSQTCKRCYRIVTRACQSDTESKDCTHLRSAKRVLHAKRILRHLSNKHVLQPSNEGGSNDNLPNE